MRDWKLYQNAQEAIEKSGSKTLTKLNEAVDAADAAQEKSKIGTFWNSSNPSDATAAAYKKAVKARDDFKRDQIKKEITLATSAPNFPGKNIVLDNLKNELELYGKEVTPLKIEKDAPAPKPTAAKPATPAAKVDTGIQSKVEASGQKYEPNKYDYRIAPDGSIQRKAK
jgi:hypothetical protein